ncbi:MAG: hypothetical protein HC942_12920 [Microcoleus sp. SU_5_6]|nr:hypothetical protein [Microcoleus sp. SU_5_6]
MLCQCQQWVFEWLRAVDRPVLPFKTVEKPGPTALLRLVEDLRPIEQNTSKGAVLSVSVRKHIGLSDWCPKADLNVIRVDLTRSDLIRNSDRN